MSQLHDAFHELQLSSMPDEEVAQLLLDCRWNADTAKAIADQRFRIHDSVAGAPGKGDEWRFIENSATECVAKLDVANRKYS
ncbi:hypothetical protein WJ36_25955 [Burkholderia ubonensis]|nr:hypothetical protein WJ36_25955 [Burkholderia ubonensis]